MSTPPDGYVCQTCNVPGHWRQQCPENKNKKRKKPSTHIPVAGTDPSKEDIDRARELQKIPPPKCFCGISSRLKKVKKSHAGGDNSRAIGHYFFFCSKKKDDDSKCRFARPVEDELKPKKERMCTFFARNGSCKKGNKCVFSHDLGSLKKKEDTDLEKSSTVESTDVKKETEEKTYEAKKVDESISSTSSGSDDDGSDDKSSDGDSIDHNEGGRDSSSESGSNSDDDSADSSNDDTSCY